MERPLVDFVVSTRNNRGIIGATLEAIGQQTVRAAACTVVDGQSTDGTVELVRGRYPWVRVIVKPTDSGPAESRNIGIRHSTADYVALVDSDVRLSPQWAEEQIALMEREFDVALAGGRLLFGDRPDLLYAAYGVMNRYAVPWDGGRAQRAELFDRPCDCLWVNTSAMMVRRTAIEDIGDFDAAMFLGCEDSDLGWRANLLGWRAVFNPRAVAVHAMHGTLEPAGWNRRLVHLIWRNRLRSMLVNYGTVNLCRYATVFVALSIADAIVHPPRKEKFAALGWNLRHLADTLARRGRVQRRRRRRDRDLWPLFRTAGVRGPGHGFEPRSADYDEPPQHPHAFVPTSTGEAGGSV